MGQQLKRLTPKRSYANRRDIRGNKIGKYDAPLKIQYQRGEEDFKRGRLTNPFDSRTDQSREWERGFTAAYHQHLQKWQQYELTRRG